MEIKRLQINNGLHMQPKNGTSQAAASGRREDGGRIKKDTLTVNGAGGMSDKQFINVIKKRILSEVSRDASEYKLNDLRDQISVGKYDVNAAEIARKMMLESEI